MRMQVSGFLLAGSCLLMACGSELQSTLTLTGTAQGTTYQVTYTAGAFSNYRNAIDSIFEAIDQSLSTWRAGSLISRINRNETDTTDEHLAAVFARAMEVAAQSNGLFDPTVGPLIQAYGFGFSKKETLTAAWIDSLRQYTGYKLIRMQAGRLEKHHPQVMLDFNAIAPGYTVDVLARFLEQKGIHNYLIELGGEVRAAGKKLDGTAWQLGIEQPTETEEEGARLHSTIPLVNLGLATSGNYKNFFIDNGKKYSHIIDPTTGYPALNNLLSTTVIAPDCTTADAWATTFMVMGLDKAKAFMTQNPALQLEAFFIYDEEGSIRTFSSKNFPVPVQ